MPSSVQSTARAVDVIVVEDDPFWLSEFARTLAGDDVRLHCVRTAEEGLALFRRRPGAVVVSDIVLPGKDGLMLLCEVRALRDDARFIAVSGGGRLGPDFYLDLAAGLGANAALAKPVNAEALRAAVFN